MSSPIFVQPGRPADAERMTNLPLQLTSFIGREQEQALVRRMILEDGARLLTLSGPPGIGKTRLALQVAADLEEYSQDGVWFVSLASIADPTLVVSAIAYTLGLKESSGRHLTEILKDYLRSKQMLLVLDNFEQVVAAGPLIPDLLMACPHLNVLVTSRQVLRVTGEHEFPVPPLHLPERIDLADVDSLANYEAVTLFTQRARASQPDFKLTNSNASAVARICVLLDGLPLALELAAARAKLMPTQAILLRLARPLSLLTGGAHDLPARQQTLRSAIEWSYDLLSEEEKLLFRRLGVFAGGCALDAAEAVCNVEGKSKANVLDDLASLVDKSLLKPELAEGREPQISGEPRFTMLETIREYALEKLEESGEADTIRGRRVDFYLEMAEQAEPELTGSPRQVEWINRLEEEHGNMRSVLGWLLEQGEVDLALRLAGTLSRFWAMRGHLSDGRRWLEASLENASDAQPNLRAKALRGAGSLAWIQGDYHRAEEQLSESIQLYGRTGDTYGEVNSLITLGNVYGSTKRDAESERAYEEGLALARQLGDRFSIARATHNLGVTARYRGDYRRALTLFEEALAFSRERGDKYMMGHGLDHVGHAMLAVGDHRGAARVLKEGMLLLGELGDKRLLAQCLLGLAGVAAMVGRPETAAHLFGAAEALREAVGVVMDHADQSEYDRYLAIARPQVSSEVFERAWQEGRAMSIEEAIATAQTVATAFEDAKSAPPADRVAAGELGGLTQRECEIAALVAQSKSNSEIAEALVVSKRTVEAHIRNILSKLDFTSRGQLAAWAIKNGLVGKPD